MALQLVTAPAAEPLTTAEALAHLRIDSSDQDTYVDSLVKAARMYCEEQTGRALIHQTWRLYLDRFPCAYGSVGPEWDVDRVAIRLPRPPFSSLTTLKYIASTGTLTTLTVDTDYTVSAYLEPARIVPAYGAFWPTPRLTVDAVQATYVAGYGTAGSSVPEPIREAMKLHIALGFEDRGDGGKMSDPETVMKRIASLLDPYRVWEYR